MNGDVSFRICKKKVHMTQLCEKALLQHPVAAGNFYKIKPDGAGGWGDFITLCREHSSSRSYPNAQALCAILEGTTIGPVLEVHIVKILDEWR